MIEQTEYRLAFILPASCQLIGKSISGTLELPTISIPMWERPAEKLTRLIKERWLIDTIVLDLLPDSSRPAPCAVIEVRSPLWKFRSDGFCAFDPDALHNSSLGEDTRRTLISMLSGVDTGRGPFSRIGWIEVARHWIQEQVCDREIRFTEEVQQMNAGGSCALIRFATQHGPAYWLKGVEAQSYHELQITRTLSRHFANYLPKMVGYREDWRAWAMEEGGVPLHESFTLPSVEQTTYCLAELQKETIGHLDTLLAIGCIDHRILALETCLSDLCKYLEEAMDCQTSTSAPRLGRCRLRELEGVLRDACSAIRNLHIPDTLIHNDINSGNILVDGPSCVFIDWCEAFVGNPFLTFQHLCAQIACKSAEQGCWLPRMRTIYREAWLDYLSETQIDQALAITPIVAIASYLYGRGQFLRSTERSEPQFQKHSRSLARHLDRAARKPELLEALCH